MPLINDMIAMHFTAFDPSGPLDKILEAGTPEFLERAFGFHPEFRNDRTATLLMSFVVRMTKLIAEDWDDALIIDRAMTRERERGKAEAEGAWMNRAFGEGIN